MGLKGRGLPFELLIGLRYLRSKGGRGFLSLLTVIAMAGMAIGVMALIVVLAVMSGFEDELRSKILGTTSHILVMDAGGRGIEDPHARPGDHPGESGRPVRGAVRPAAGDALARGARRRAWCCGGSTRRPSGRSSGNG